MEGRVSGSVRSGACLWAYSGWQHGVFASHAKASLTSSNDPGMDLLANEHPWQRLHDVAELLARAG